MSCGALILCTCVSAGRKADAKRSRSFLPTSRQTAAKSSNRALDHVLVFLLFFFHHVVRERERAPPQPGTAHPSSPFAVRCDARRGRRVYLGNLNPNVDKSEVQREFQKFGALADVWVARNPPGFSFLEFEDARDAEVPFVI
jgi:hypothetical protein